MILLFNNGDWVHLQDSSRICWAPSALAVLVFQVGDWLLLGHGQLSAGNTYPSWSLLSACDETSGL